MLGERKQTQALVLAGKPRSGARSRSSELLVINRSALATGSATSRVSSGNAWTW
jgi:hypothetical protein